jgi:GT2 family glycosyltransferase
MPNDVEVSIIVVNYKTKDLTLDCLKSIYRECSRKSFEIILVDNNSEDGSAEAFREQFPGVKLLALHENIGFGRANNLAAQHATGNYLLLLNPDTVVLDDAIYRLMDFASSRPSAGIWGGRTYLPDMSLNPASCWGRMTLWSLFCSLTGLRSRFFSSRFFNTEGYGGWRRDTVAEVDIVTGCLLLIGRDLWDRLGGFDPVFFMYGEDCDLCLRAKALGYRPAITPNASIIHYVGQSEWLPPRKRVQLLAAAVTIIRRHWPWPKRLPGYLLVYAHPYLRFAAYWMLSQLPAKAHARENFEVWKTVVEHRQEWISGFGSQRVPQTVFGAAAAKKVALPK